MLKTIRKKRAPYAQLSEAALIAKSMMVAKGLVSSKSIFEQLKNDSNAPILPGYPPYLPDQWTLERSKQIVYDIVKKWVKSNNGDEEKQERFDMFCRFAIRRLVEQERIFRAKVRKESLKDREMEPLSEIFSNARILSTARSMTEFIVASMTVSYMVKANGSVSDYLAWFIEDYTPKLNDLWRKSKK